jgi:hypothetical protein
MKRPTNVEKLRAQLAALIAKPGPVGQRGREMWSLAEEIAAASGEPVRRVFDRGARDAAALLKAEVTR